jgi:hypothetical protein
VQVLDEPGFGDLLSRTTMHSIVEVLDGQGFVDLLPRTAMHSIVGVGNLEGITTKGTRH